MPVLKNVLANDETHTLTNEIVTRENKAENK